MIIEGLLTTQDRSGRLNLAPMGPVVEADFVSLRLRPFQSSTTYDNLCETRCAVFHVIDHVDVVAAAAIGNLTQVPPHDPAVAVNGRVLQDCCRWFELQIVAIDDTGPRAEMTTTIVHRGVRRSFFGFNRARHAIIEAAILATRVHLLDQNEIIQQLEFLRPAVTKTGGPGELATFEMLVRFITSRTE